MMISCVSKNQKKYLKEDRLEDVLALIQVLSIDEKSHRSEQGLEKELSNKPNSSSSWTQLAHEHREFFRVIKDKKFPISLVIRHVSEDNENTRPPLSPENTQTLLNTAIELHDRQLKRSQKWTVLIPIWVAVASLISVLIK